MAEIDDRARKFPEAFKSAQRDSLGFLRVLYGFECTKLEATRVGSVWMGGTATYSEPLLSRSTQSRRHVKLHVAPFRLEMDLEVGFGTQDEEWFCVSELCRLAEESSTLPRVGNLFDVVDEPVGLREEFDKFVRLLRAAGTRFFDGDETLVSDLRRQRDRKG